MFRYWALGFHQCRYGYIDVQSLRDVVGNYSANKVSSSSYSDNDDITTVVKIPLDGIWSDIDYMDEVSCHSLHPLK